MSSNASGTYTPQGGERRQVLLMFSELPSSHGLDSSVVPAIQQAEHKSASSRPMSIAFIKPQRNDQLGTTPEKFRLVVKSRGGETLRKSKWDSARGGWPVGLVQIRGLNTENLSIELRELRVAGLIAWTIARGPLTLKDVESTIHASQDQLETSIDILSQHGLSVTGKRLVLIIEISTPSFLPVWITLVALAEPPDGLTDQTLKDLELIFKSREGKRLKKSAWNLFQKCWDVGLPQLRGEATEQLSIVLRRKRRGGLGILYRTLTTVKLSIEEGEQARKEAQKEIRKIFAIPPHSGLNVERLVLVFQTGTLDMPTPDMDGVVLPRSMAEILDNTWVIAEALEKLSGMLQAKHELDAKLMDLVESMNQLYGCAIVKDALSNYATFQVLFDAMIQQSVECFLFMSNYVSDGYFRHMLTASKKIDRFRSSFENLRERFNDEQLRDITITTMAIKDLVVGLHESIQHLDQKLGLYDMKRVLEEELGTTKFRLSSHLPRCLLGTRQHTLSKIIDWIIRGKESFLWLSGVAGSGKSSVMATLHDYLRTMGCSGRLAAYVRFRRGEFETPSKFVQALIYQLADFESGLGMEIANAVQGSTIGLPLFDQLQSFFIHPLKSHKAKMIEQGQMVVLVDGLDECMKEAGGSDAFHELLTLFSHLASPKTFHSLPFLRFIVASRPEAPISAAFTQPSNTDNDPDHPNIHHLRLDTSSPETTADILEYLKAKLEEIFQKNDNFRKLCKQENAIPRLARSSHGLFIWANVLVRFLRLAQNHERLQLALDMNIPKDASAFDVLKELYSAVLDSVVPDQRDEDVRSRIRSILGLVIAVGRLWEGHSSLTEPILRGLLRHLDGKVDNTLSLLPKLGAVIEGVHSPGAELILLHKSFEDYLTDESRAVDGWYIDVKGHWMPKVAKVCIQMVHSDIFGNTPQTSDLLHFAHRYWTLAFFAQLDENCPFPINCELSDGLVLEILQQGFLQWVFCVHNLRLGVDKWEIFDHFDHGLRDVRTALGIPIELKADMLVQTRDTIKHTPEIVSEVLETFLRQSSIRLPTSSLSETMTGIFLFLFIYPELTPTLRKLYLPQFSNIASGSRDFWTILDALASVTLDSLDLFGRLKPTNMLDYNIDSDKDSMRFEISGVPDILILWGLNRGRERKDYEALQNINLDEE